MAFYWDNPVKHDRPLITNELIPGLAVACGLRPTSKTAERDLDMLLANVALAHEEERPLSYSRNRSHDFRGDITHGRLMAAAGEIVRADLAMERRTKPGHRGWQSVLRATPALVDVFGRHGQEPVRERDPAIITRSRKDGSLLPTPPMRERERQVERINEMLRSTRIDLSMTGALRLANGLWLFERLDESRPRPELLRQVVRMTHLTGRRVFTSDQKQHGRFYCSPQSVPGEYRRRMHIDGSPVVELDFQAMHPRLAYDQCGVQLDGDPYEIPGFTRKQGKLGLLTAFNAKTHQAAVGALTDARSGQPIVSSKVEAQCLLAAPALRHSPIKSMLGSDAGMTLMNRDSKIMLLAADALVMKGIPCVPIHDSLMVPVQHEGDAREALGFGWNSGCKNPWLNPCSIEKKPQKVLQDGRGGCPPPISSSFLPAPPSSGPPSGWWSSVLAEARHDVAAWCSA